MDIKENIFLRRLNGPNILKYIQGMVLIKFYADKKGGHFTAVANVLDCDIEVRDFELLSRYYVRFQKAMNPFLH